MVRFDWGNDTVDRVFLLSYDEVLRYFGDSGMVERGKNSDERDRRLGWSELGMHLWGIHDQYSEYRIANDLYGRSAGWWLRTPGESFGSVAYVGSEGSINLRGNRSYWGGNGFRPALWLYNVAETNDD